MCHSLHITTGPASPPDGIMATTIMSMSVTIEWNEVPIQNRNGIIRGYTVGGSIQQFHNDSGQARMRRFAHLMTNLSAGVRDCLMSSNRSESLIATLNDTQRSVTFSNLGKRPIVLHIAACTNELMLCSSLC